MQSTQRLVVAAVLACFLAEIGSGAEFQDCGDGTVGDFTSITVSNCSESNKKCPLFRGKNASITINFTAKQEVQKVKQVVHGILAPLPMPVPFPLDSPDACEHTGLSCPLEPGAHTYQYLLPVKTSYPKVSVKVKWELLDESDKQIICVLIPAELK